MYQVWLKAIMPLSTFASFLQHKRSETGRYRPDPVFTCVYNFVMLSPISENSLSCPTLWFLLSKQTKRYGITFIPGAKTDT